MDKQLIRIHSEAATSRYSARCRTVSTLIRSTHSQGLFWLRLEAKAYRRVFSLRHSSVALNFSVLPGAILICNLQLASHIFYPWKGGNQIALLWLGCQYPFEVAFQGSIPSKRFEDCTMKMLGPQWQQDTMRLWDFSRKTEWKRQWCDFTIFLGVTKVLRSFMTTKPSSKPQLELKDALNQ